MRITALKPDKRHAHLTHVDIDGARFACITVELVRELKLANGQELDDQLRERLEFLADVEASYRVATRMLAARPRSVNETLRKLRERGHNPSAASRAVGRLEASGLLNDREFASHFARVRAARGHGPARLLGDLLAKGVERRLAERAIAEVVADEEYDELGQARRLAEKRMGQLGSLPTTAMKRRLLQYLGRRGFRGYEVTDLVGEMVRSQANGGDG